MFTIKKYVVVDSLEEAYKLNKSKKANVLGGLLWMKMGKKTIQTAIDLYIFKIWILRSSYMFISFRQLCKTL